MSIDTVHRYYPVTLLSYRKVKVNIGYWEGSVLEGFGMDLELNNFMQLNFITLAGELGFVRDERESSGRSHVLRSGSGGDKLAAKERSDGSWCYFNVHDHSDRGCIVNLVQRCLGLSLGYTRKWIRETAGVANTSFPIPVLKSSPSTDATKPTVDHHKKARAVWNAATWEPEPAYLLSRGLDRETLNDPRFADCWRVNKHGTVLFPHYDRTGMCGYEYRSEDFKGFGRDVHKGLWFSRNAKAASEIVVTESQIDAMSHFQLYGGSQAYVSHNGSLGPLQIGLMEAVLVKAEQRNAWVTIATDNDQAGEDFYSLFQSIAPMELERLVPVGNDWNEDVQYVNRENQ